MGWKLALGPKLAGACFIPCCLLLSSSPHLPGCSRFSVDSITVLKAFYLICFSKSCICPVLEWLLCAGHWG